ncbi:MAG: DMT family protein [Phycisphaerales bacterium]
MFRTILLLSVSNLFMTVAWYGHLRFKQSALWTAIFISWLIAFLEYCFQVPANRIGYTSGLSAAQLKTIQEVITLTIFVVFAWLYLDETPKWNVILGFLLILLGATCIFKPWAAPALSNP